MAACSKSTGGVVEAGEAETSQRARDRSWHGLTGIRISSEKDSLSDRGSCHRVTAHPCGADPELACATTLVQQLNIIQWTAPETM